MAGWVKKGTIVGGLEPWLAGGWLGRRPMSVSDGHMGSRVSALPGQAMIDWHRALTSLKSSMHRSRTDVCCCFTLAMCPSTHGCGVGRRDRGLRQVADHARAMVPWLESHFPDWEQWHESQ